MIEDKVKKDLFDSFICPFGCQESKPIDFGTEKTLVGWFGGEDPNHHTQHGQCNICNKKFAKHYVIRGRKVWFTDDKNNCLLGEPGCCHTSYSVKCQACQNGWMTHSCHNSAMAMSIVNGYTVPNQPMNFTCNNCGSLKEDPSWVGFSTNELIKEAIKKYQSMPEKETKPISFTIKEDIGTSYYNKIKDWEIKI